MTFDAANDDSRLQITLLQERSAGTFARVYLAEARGGGGLARVVAVKVIKEQWSDSHEILTRTRDEARLLARLQHRNILRVEALAEVDGQPAIVMEFVDGLDLQQLIERLARAKRRIPRRSVYRIMADACSAVAAAWEEVPVNGSGPLRVVHRDLKPGNVMISKQGEVKVLDFGTARFDVGDRLASTGALRFGSLKYMSPERRMGDRGDHPSDVYALGLMCIEMLLGEILPVLPIEEVEHDSMMWDCIDRLADLGLPDERWDEAVRQTLRGMIAADPNRRLHASQLYPLFRSFSDSATGESLEAFAGSTVARIAREVHGGPPSGDLAGSRVFVAMTTSSDLPVPDQAPRLVAASRMEAAPQRAERPTPVTVAITADEAVDPGRKTGLNAEDDLPTTIGQPSEAMRSISTPPGSRPLPVRAAPVDGGFQEVESVTRPSLSEPTPAPRAKAPTPQRPPPPVRAAPAPRSNLAIALMTGLGVFLVGGLVMSVAGVAVGVWWYTQQRPDPIELVTAERVLPPSLAEAGLGDDPPPGGEVAAGDGALVHLDSKDELVQWLAIEDSAGTRLLKGSPGGEARLPAGDYVLLGKVRARGTARAALSLTGELHLDCQSAEKGEVHCLPGGGGEALVLRP